MLPDAELPKGIQQASLAAGILLAMCGLGALSSGYQEPYAYNYSSDNTYDYYTPYPEVSPTPFTGTYPIGKYSTLTLYPDELEYEVGDFVELELMNTTEDVASVRFESNNGSIQTSIEPHRASFSVPNAATFVVTVVLKDSRGIEYRQVIERPVRPAPPVRVQ